MRAIPLSSEGVVVGKRRGGRVRGVPATLLLLFSFLLPSLVGAASQSLLGPEQFTRTSGATTIYTRTVTVPPTVVAPYTLRLVNGNPNTATNRVAIEDAVSSGRILINGVEVVSPSAFSQTTAIIDTTVSLTASNTLEVQLSSAPNSYITVTLSGISTNRAPVANAGPDQAVATGRLVTLDGSASSDPDGDLVTYSWTLTAKPTGSTAALSVSTAVRPTFTADVDGVYRASLVVSDGALSSAADEVVITATRPNTPPTANAGLDQQVVAGALVTLDGSLSFDPDRDLITYRWAFVSVPTGSAATLTNPTTARPTFTADVPGTYTVRLLVHDGRADSAPDDVVVTAARPNNPPVANAGPDQTVVTGTLVTLNGGASYDPDGDPLTYQWSLGSRPTGSVAALTNPTSVSPTFTPDLTGEYVINLVVSDGTVTSAVDVVVVVAARPNAAPTANAGPDQSVKKGSVVTLDGSASFDPDRDPLTYAWNVVSLPTGSTAILANPTTASPTFTADQSGNYVVRLVVNDGRVDSAPDTVVIISVNDPPVASAGPDRTAFLDTSVSFNGGASSDPNGDALTYAWTIAAVPAGSAAMLTGAATVTPAFTPDVAGTYVLRLVVHDGEASSVPDEVILTAVVPPPSITALMPTSGPLGATLTITGRYFDPTASNNEVRVNGTRAIITSVTPTTITTTIPLGAASGPITVTTPHGIGTSPGPFSVVPRADFRLTALPAQATVLQGGAATYLVAVEGIGAFSQLVTLGISGLPPGATARFDSPALAAGGRAALTLTTGATTPLGSATLLVNGTAVLDIGTRTETVALILQVTTGGRTAVSGQFLTVDGAPIPGVVVRLGAVQTMADAAGNFLLADVTSGAQQLMIDANTARPGYPIYAADVTLTASQTTTLPPFRITPPPPPERFTPIANAAATQVITDPRFPGVAITLPAGVTITGWDGTVKNKIAIERLSPDRLPVPSPPGFTRSLYQIYFGTPMGGVPSAPLPVTGPNDLDLNPGEQAELWYYDASPMGGVAGWRKAGLGTVSADGTRIVSNPGVGIQRFCGVCGLLCWIRNQLPQPNRNPEAPQGGDPVDLTMGQLLVDNTDLVLPGRSPVTIARTYNPFDPFGTIADYQAPLGLGWSLSVDLIAMPISGDVIRLILPGNGRFDFAKQADGTFRHQTHPLFLGAEMSTLSGGDHQLRFKDGRTWRFRPLFLGLEFLIEQSDRNGNRVTIERLSDGKLSRVVDAADRAIEVTYTGSRISQLTDPIGRTVQYGYDASGRLAMVTDLAGGVTRYTYDASGHILTITDARNITFLANEYSPDGRVIRQTAADGGVTTFEYELVGSLPVATTVIDPRGNRIRYRFNGQGHITESTDALGQTTRDERAATNQVLVTTDPLGRATAYTYDVQGNVTSTTDAAGHVTQSAYEPVFNRVTQITDARGQITRFTYDAQGNLLSTTDPLNHTTTMTYNAFGQPITVTDPLGNTTRFEYDDVGNLAASIDPLGNRTTRLYDSVSRLIAVTDPRSFTTIYGYDALNRVTAMTDAAGGVTGFTYDPNGNLLTVTDAKNQTTTYTYDAQDRLATRTDALNRVERYAYDRNGNLTTFTDRKGQVATFQYDGLNRRVQASYGDGSRSDFVYDAAGRLVRASDTTSGAIEMAYDALNRLTQELTPQGVVTYSYDGLGRRTTMTVNGQPPVSYGYDLVGRLTSVAQGLQTVSLGYDRAGRRTMLSYPNGTSTAYNYDADDRMTRILHQGPTSTIEDLTYGYDAAGNRLAVGRNGAQVPLPTPVQAAYDAANEQIQFNNPLPNLTYDANGNLTSQTAANGTTTYTWDGRNRLVVISGPGISASFVYDALGRRMSKTINGVRTDYQYDGQDIVAELGGGAVGATYLRSLRIDEPFVRQGGSPEYYHGDALGSTVRLTDGAGATSTTYAYGAFGKTTATGTSSNPFQYTGRENDGTGLYYYRARYYSVGLSRFLNEDPIRFIGGLNFYNYVDNNPLRFVDPLGTEKKASTNCELTTPSGIRVMVECPAGDPTRIPQNITPSPPPCPCSLDGACFAGCMLVQGTAAIGFGCSECTIGPPQWQAACATVCVPVVTSAVAIMCKYKCTVCTQ